MSESETMRILSREKKKRELSGGLNRKKGCSAAVVHIGKTCIHFGTSSL